MNDKFGRDVMNKLKKLCLTGIIGVCCLLAAGCGGSEDTVNGTNGAISENNVADENRKFVLTVAINPEFMLYLSSELKITEVFCMNEDAKTLFADLDVTNMSYEEGLGQILDAALEKKFITAENPEIEVELAALDDGGQKQAAELKESVAEQILSFKEENSLELAVEVSQPEKQKVFEADLTMDGEVIGKQIAYFDENDKCVKQVCLWDDGLWGIWEKEYSSAGKLVKQYIKGPSGFSEEWYNEQEQCTKRMDYNADGSISEQTYSNGILEKIFTQNTDGSTDESLYYENGNIKWSVTRDANGNKIMEHTYRENGEVGDVATAHFYENGNLWRFVEYQDDGTNVDTEYYENGNIRSVIHVSANGNIIKETWYDENGNPKK